MQKCVKYLKKTCKCLTVCAVENMEDGDSCHTFTAVNLNFWQKTKDTVH